MNPTIGIFGGSFNPVHNGHIALAQAIAQSGIVDKVWITLSPQNPLKVDSADPPASDAHRLAMLQLAIEGHDHLEVCDIELSLPRPSYTINTLEHLQQLYPSTSFRLIIGADNMLAFNRWYRHDDLLAQFKPIVYPRPGYDIDSDSLPRGVTYLSDINLYPESSSEIRSRLRQSLPVNNMLPSGVLNYIKTHRLYT